MKPALFNENDRKMLHDIWDGILDRGEWSEGRISQAFECEWGIQWGTGAAVFSSWSGAMEAVIDFYELQNRVVFVPANTFLGSLYPFMRAGCRIIIVDCNLADLCMSFDSLSSLVKKETVEDRFDFDNPPVVLVAHIGGHICFDIRRIKSLCDNVGMVLIEDCAHAAGASWNGQKPGSWGVAGVFSLYATKTISTGEGGVLVSEDKGMIEHAKKWRKYGKVAPNQGQYDLDIVGLNYQMDEFRAALGLVQLMNFKKHMEKKRAYVEQVLMPKYQNHLKLPPGMKSGYYKFIVFDKIENSTGKVYDYCLAELFDHNHTMNASLIKANHWCVPIEL